MDFSFIARLDTFLKFSKKLHIVMPPRTTEVGRGFPTFRVRSSIVCRYGPGLAPSFRRKKDHTPVSCRQVRVHRRHGQELLPFP